MRRYLAILLILFTSQAWATDYYFATGGNDADNVCTQVAPCAGLAKLASLTANAGDRFFFNRGDTFPDTSANGIDWTSRSGTSGSHIVISAYGTGARPIWDKSDKSGYGIILKSSDWIDISSIHIRDYQFSIELRGARNITIDDMVLDSPGNHCLKPFGNSADGLRSSRDVSVTNSELTNCGAGGGNGEGFYLGNNTSSDQSGNFIISNNYVHDTSYECLEVKQGTNPAITITHNTFENCHAGNHDVSDMTGDSGVGIVATGAGGENSEVVFKFNWVKDVVGNVNDTTGVGARWQSQGMDGQFNVFANNEGEGLVLSGSSGNQQNWFFNTIYGNGRECTNVSGTTKTLADNTCWANASGNDASNPGFVNAASNNFNITATSPLYQAGAGGLSKGALQSFAWTAAAVGVNGTVLTVTGNVYTEFRPIATGTASAFTITCSTTGAQAGVSLLPGASNTVDVSLATPVIQGETCTLGATAAAASDSANIGGTLAPGGPLRSTSLVLSGLSVTNNSLVGSIAPNLLASATLIAEAADLQSANGCAVLADGFTIENDGLTTVSATTAVCEWDLGAAKQWDTFRSFCDNSGTRKTTNVSIGGKVNLGDSYTAVVTDGVCNARQWFQFDMGDVTYRYVKITATCSGCPIQVFEYDLTETPQVLPSPGVRTIVHRGALMFGFR